MLALLLALGVPQVARAHATLLRSTPAAGSRLGTSPTSVTLVFSEALEPAMTHLMLISSDGRITTLDPAGDAHDVNALMAPVAGTLAAGAWRVAWHIVSADGHPVQGSFVFLVGTGAGTALPPEVAHDTDAGAAAWGPTAGDAPLLPAAARGLALGALMALAGLLHFQSTARDGRSSPPSRAVLVLAIATPLLLALHIALWAINASPGHLLTGESITDALASQPGRVEAARLGLAVLALWAVVLARRGRLALLFAVLALAVSGATGHSAAIQPAVTIPSKAIHLLAGSVWLGGLLWLLICRRDGARADRHEVSRVSTAALVALVVVTLTGAAQALLFMDTPRDVVRTFYGTVVVAKVFGVIALALFGAHHRYRVMPRLEGTSDVHARFRRTLRYELLIMSAVILLGGLLAYVPPAPALPHMAGSAHSHTSGR
jgi:copper transport protein